MAGPPTVPPIAEVVSLAVTLHQSNHLDEAEELYRRALERSPDHADALHFLGVLCHQRGESSEAIRLIRLALRSNAKYLGARINLGNVLKETGRHAEAETEYRQVIDADPNIADAWNNLGVVQRLQKKVDESVSSFQRATKLNPRHADAFQNLGNALKSARQFEDSLTAYRKAVEIDPAHTEAHLSLGRALYSIGRLDEATTVYRQWLEVEPDNPVAQHMLTACEGADVPERCSDEFVKQSFDAFAASFEEVLSRLDYCAPALIAEAVQQQLPIPTRQFVVLDAGCGTGLCGEALRPYASRLIGIDLSPKMIDKTRAMGLYDESIEAELTQYMASHPDQFDLIASADTLVYFGALGDAFNAAVNAMRPGGVFVFSVESADMQIAPMGYVLNPHGRYSHAESYVTQSLSDAGLTLRSISHAVLRQEVRQPVNGMIVTATKDSL